MSTTVIQLLTDALRLVNIINSNQSPSAEQGIQALHVLNEMMADVQADGLQMGWYPIADADIATEAPISDEDIRSVKWCLGLELCPYFGIEPLPQHQTNAQDAYTRLAKRKVLYLETDVSMLPQGETGYGWPFIVNN
jgi:hypothetical protein